MSDPLSMTASIIAVMQLASTVMNYVNSVTYYSKEKTQIGIEASNMYNLLTGLRYRVEEAQGNDVWFNEVKLLNAVGGSLDQFRETLEKLVIKIDQKTKLSEFEQALTWYFSKDDVAETLSKIDRLQSLVSLALSNDLGMLSQQIKNDMAGVSADVQTLARRNDCELLTELADWLGAPDPSTNFYDACMGRQGGTGTWLLEDARFLEWTYSPSSLWLHGIPGCGKTVLSATIIEHVIASCRGKSSAAYAYFYFDFNNRVKQKPDNLIRSLLLQLCLQLPQNTEVVKQIYYSYRAGQTSPHMNTLKKLLGQSIAAFKDTFIVIDGLNECLNNDEMLDLIQDLSQTHDKILHLLFTSRRQADIERRVKPYFTHEIEIQPSVIDLDIQTYIKARFQQDPAVKKWPTSAKQKVEEALLSKSLGCFRWVYCQFEDLRKCLHRRDVLAKLNDLPENLYGSYHRVLSQIEADGHLDQAVAVLQWLCFSRRPLEADEVGEVLGIELESNGQFEPEDRLADPQDVLAICASLISVQKTPDSRCGFEIRLAHFTVQEYLLSEESAFASHFEPEIVHGMLAEASLVYLLYVCQLDSVAVTKDASGADGDYYPLTLYAAEYWTTHFNLGKHNGLDAASRYARKFFEPDLVYLEKWIDVCDADRAAQRCLDWSVDFPPSRLYCAARCGLIDIVKSLIEEGEDVNGRYCVGRYGYALQAAISNKHEDVVRLLIEAGADVNAGGNGLETAMSAAAVAGHLGIAHQLLDAGADVNRGPSDDLGPLSWAAIRGDEDMLHLLIESGANVNNGALVHASHCNQVSMARTLIEKGADINACNERGLNALHRSSASCHIDMTRFLIRSGADVNTKTGKGARVGNAIQAVLDVDDMDWGQVEVLQALVDAGAKANEHDLRRMVHLYRQSLGSLDREVEAKLVPVMIKATPDTNNEHATNQAKALIGEAREQEAKAKLDEEARERRRAARHERMKMVENKMAERRAMDSKSATGPTVDVKSVSPGSSDENLQRANAVARDRATTFI